MRANATKTLQKDCGYLLTVPGVEIRITAPPEFCALDKYREETLLGKPDSPEDEAWLKRRNWKELRRRFQTLDLSDGRQTAAWLNQVGYRCPHPPNDALWLKGQGLRRRGQLALTRPHSGVSFQAYRSGDSADTRGVTVVLGPPRPFEPEDIDEELTAWLRERRNVVRWLMVINKKHFLDALRFARTYPVEVERYNQQVRPLNRELEQLNREFAAGEITGDEFDKRRTSLERRKPARPLPPDRSLKDKLEKVGEIYNAPLDKLDDGLLGKFLVGTPNLPCHFNWDYRGEPSVTVLPRKPMEAITFAIHTAKNFTVERWSSCSECGRGVDADRRTPHCFCREDGGRCQKSYFNRRKRMMQDADKEWHALTPKQRKDRCEFIASRVKNEVLSQPRPHDKYKDVTATLVAKLLKI